MSLTIVNLLDLLGVIENFEQVFCCSLNQIGYFSVLGKLDILPKISKNHGTHWCQLESYLHLEKISCSTFCEIFQREPLCCFFFFCLYDQAILILTCVAFYVCDSFLKDYKSRNIFFKKIQISIFKIQS